ncbi:MAG: DUF4450 domain-containing protein [Paludibacter sp.]|jgi:hypothetical protein|nr:DUF4450 domain-containing protein [Paludibacter sp.]
MKHTKIFFLLFFISFLQAQNPPKRIGDYIESNTFNQPVTTQHRKLNYTPEGDAFVCVNGNNRFTRALYGSNTLFRLETSDRPVFATYTKSNNKNIAFAVSVGTKTLPLDSTEYCKSWYIAGRRNYEIKDKLLGTGSLFISALAMADNDGAVWQIDASKISKDIRLVVSVSDIRISKLNRNGDMGADPADAFEASLNPSKKQTMEIDLKKAKIIYVSILNQIPKYETTSDGNAIFTQAETARQKIASTVTIKTPDPYLNALGGVLSTAADGIWDGNVWQHGAIGWRTPLPGWRAAYTGDVVGWHDRARIHFDNYAASQVKNVLPVLPQPQQDPKLNLSRGLWKWGTNMYSNGYICRSPNRTDQMNHYDMNLVYIDELLWHLCWTGDLDYAKRIFPVIETSLKWEKRNWDADNDGLYDAYACIWASDALQYNSGSVTYSSAYNYRANKMAAIIAEKIGENPTPYKNEAAKILNAINTKLWIKDKGWWAEFQDFMGNQLVHSQAGIWTVYHAMDSEIQNSFQAYQATKYIDNYIPHIPIIADEIEGNYSTISTSSWLPYSWSINNVAFAEVMHTALAYWQAGRTENATLLFKSAILDGMYLGRSPGNIGQISHYDKARGESYRDFGDPVGIYARAIVQGLFGILPDALNDTLRIKPGFPAEWNFASISTPDITVDFQRTDLTDVYKIENRFAKTLALQLIVNAKNDLIQSLKVNGETVKAVISENVAAAQILINCGKDKTSTIEIIWAGKTLENQIFTADIAADDNWKLQSTTAEITGIYDPQNLILEPKIESHTIAGKVSKNSGFHSLFLQLKQGEMTWWQPIDLNIQQKFSVEYDAELSKLQFAVRNNTQNNFAGKIHINPFSSGFAKEISIAANGLSDLITIPDDFVQFGTNVLQIEENGQIIFTTQLINWNLSNQNPTYQTVVIDRFFNDSISKIFKNEYLSPRSPYTTLQIPKQGIGEWCHPMLTAEIDDSGLRSASANTLFPTPFGVPFRIGSEKNIVFSSLWDNFPTRTLIPLVGKAQHAYLLMAGTTNHMQYHVPNGIIIVHYLDNTADSLVLTNPENWAPIEQDFYTDGLAFSIDVPRPYRVSLKTGIVSRNLERYMNIKPTEVYGREIDGGAGIVLDIPLNKNKFLKNVELKTIANEVIIGIMGITLLK